MLLADFVFVLLLFDVLVCVWRLIWLTDVIVFDYLVCLAVGFGYYVWYCTWLFSSWLFVYVTVCLLGYLF